MRQLSDKHKQENFVSKEKLRSKELALDTSQNNEEYLKFQVTQFTQEERDYWGDLLVYIMQMEKKISGRFYSSVTPIFLIMNHLLYLLSTKYDKMKKISP